MRKLLLIMLSSILIFSCQKPNDNPGPDPDPTLPQQPADYAEAIILSTRDFDANRKATAALTAYNLDGTVKWKRDNLGSSITRELTYKDGILYTSASYFQFIDGGPSYISYNNLYAISVSTGTNIWANTESNDHILSTVATKDTLYCSIARGMVNYVGAYSTATGVLLWKKQISFPYPALNLKIEGNTLYFVTASSVWVNNVIAFDIPSQTIKWNTPIGINLDSYSSLVLTDNSIFLKNGKATLLALAKTTGETLWSQTFMGYEDPVIDNNTVFSLHGKGLTALNVSSGEMVWQWNNGDYYFAGSNLVLTDKKIYISGSLEKRFISRIDAATGSVEWWKETNEILQYPVVAADQLFLFKSTNLNTVPIPQIMIYETATGVAKDSFAVYGDEFKQHYIITKSGKWLQN